MDSGLAGLIAGITALVVALAGAFLNWFKEKNKAAGEDRAFEQQSSDDRETRAGEVWKTLVQGLEARIKELQEEIKALRNEITGLKDLLTKASEQTAARQEDEIKLLRQGQQKNAGDILRQAQQSPAIDEEDPTKPQQK